MRHFVFDADILSTFAKVNKINFLRKAFGKGKLLIPPAVVEDLKRSKTISVNLILDSKLFTQISLSKEELSLKENISKQKTLGEGETECIALCKARNSALVTNDSKAVNFAENIGIDVIDLESILHQLKKILNTKELRQLINDIETKDKVIIVNKEEILTK